MSAFLLLLVKLNLAMGAAIILVSLLRRLLRLSFGAPIAYALWLLVPIAGIASLFPPRVLAPVPVMPVHVPAPVFAGPIAQSALQVTKQLTGQSAFTAPIAAAQLVPAHAMPDIALLLFAAWALGTLLMALYLARLQFRFSAAVRAGGAGPAVLGFFRPRVVTPEGFQEYFTPQEQAAILAHERVHMARQDARINALTALLRCLCWFNPLIHLGARWLRIDQELACDATVVAGAISRRDYASALLKSQMVVMALPLGCSWPGSQHPLIERIALLKRKPAGAARRLAGAGLVILAATSAGVGAWAAQPPVAAKAVAVKQPSLAQTTLPATRAAQDRTDGTATSNPTGSGSDDDASKNGPAGGAVSAAPVAQAQASPDLAMTTNAQSSIAQRLPPIVARLPTNQVAANQAAQPASQTSEAATTDAATRLAAAPPLPKEVAASDAVVAPNDPPATPVQSPPDASPAMALNDPPAAPIQPTARVLSVGPVQAALATPAKAANSDSNDPYVKRTCRNVPNNSITGRVTSSTTIQMPKFACEGEAGGNRFYDGEGWRYDSWIPCKNGERGTASLIWGRVCPDGPWLTMSVQLSNPTDASKMPTGKLVTLTGDFFVLTKNKVDYLFVQHAKVLRADPFGR